jgi:hypothetical protein
MKWPVEKKKLCIQFCRSQAECSLFLFFFFVLLWVLLPALQRELSADQKYPQKVIYELNEKCKKSAYEFWKINTLGDDLKSQYLCHYNKKYNSCFINMTASYLSGVSGDRHLYKKEILTDLNKHKTQGVYYGMGKKVNDKPSVCYVGDKNCKSYDEFHKLIAPYMKE